MWVSIKTAVNFCVKKIKTTPKYVFVFYYIVFFFMISIYVRIKFKTEAFKLFIFTYFLNICLSLNLYIATTVSLQNVLRTFDVRNTEFVRVLYQRKHFFGCAMRHFLYSSIMYLGTIQTCFI